RARAHRRRARAVVRPRAAPRGWKRLPFSVRHLQRRLAEQPPADQPPSAAASRRGPPARLATGRRRPARPRPGRQARRAIRRLSATVGASLERLVADAADAVLVFDAAGDRIRYVNGGACRLLGYERSELLTVRISSLYSGQGAE